jgi:glucan phosphoethanolaminetransferase (alkaline phosphatase superfamily)
VAIIAALYTVHFHLEALANFCLTLIYGYPAAALAIPPWEIPRVGGRLWFAAALIGCWVYVYALFSALAVRRGLFAVALPLIFAASGIAAHFVNNTGVPLSANLMEAFFETNTQEAGEALSLRLFLSIGFALAIGIALLRVFWSQLRHPTRGIPGTSWLRACRWLRGGAGVLVTAYALLAPLEEPLAVYPDNLLRAAGEYLHNRLEIGQRLANRRDISAAGVDWKRSAPDDLVIVVVIGESARSDHFSLNGYARATNPRLAAVANLVSFRDVTACATLTRTAVPCLMTRATRATPNISLEERSVISVFNRLGFTTAWLSVNGVYNKLDNAVSAVGREAQLREFRGSIPRIGRLIFDGHLLPSFERILSEHLGRRFIVLHTMGSHFSYDRRYPKKYKHFLPICDNAAIESCDRLNLTNSYDNSILYTDSVLARVIRRLQPLNAVLLYVADHGQLLGEDGRYMHGQDRPEVLHIPMLWWASDRFLHDYPAEFARLTARRNDAVSHDYVFHSLLDCVGVRSPVIDRTLSLCREAGDEPGAEGSRDPVSRSRLLS